MLLPGWRVEGVSQTQLPQVTDSPPDNIAEIIDYNKTICKSNFGNDCILYVVKINVYILYHNLPYIWQLGTL